MDRAQGELREGAVPRSIAVKKKVNLFRREKCSYSREG